MAQQAFVRVPPSDEADWLPLAEFEFESKRVIAQYTKAVANVAFETTGTCSGFLINDRMLITNEHCSDNNLLSEPGTGGEPLVQFGIWAEDERFALGEAFARRRLIQHGYRSVRVAELSGPEIRSFECRRMVKSDVSDVALWECGPKTMSNGITVDPGTIWGHVEAQYDFRFSTGAGSDMVSMNRRTPRLPSDEGLPKVVLASYRGGIEDKWGQCTSSYSRCFTHCNDSLDGSSGGAVFNQANARVVGANSGRRTPGGFALNVSVLGPTIYKCNGVAHNVGAYLQRRDFEPFFRDETYSQSKLSPPLDQRTHFPLPRVGEITGPSGEATAIDLECGPNSLVAGVVGTTFFDGENAPVGNLGIVCSPVAPHDVGRRGDLDGDGLPDRHDVVARPTDLMRVYAIGSDDTTGPIPTADMPLNIFLNEALIPERDTASGRVPNELVDQQQTLVMCPPQHFLIGMTFRVVPAMGTGGIGTTLGKVEQIFCQSVGGNRTSVVVQESTDQIGTSGVDDIAAGRVTRACSDTPFCGSDDHCFVHAASINSAFTGEGRADGIKLECVEL